MFDYEVEFSSVIRGHHVYKAAWSPIIGESLACRKDDVKKLKNTMNTQLGLTFKLITNLLGMCRWNFPSLYSHFSRPAMRTKYRSKGMDQGDWKTDLLSLDPSWPERPAEQSPQNLKKRLFV